MTLTAISERRKSMKRNTQLLTLKEVASKLRVSHRQVYLMVEEKRFPEPVRFGRSVRWREAAVDAFIDGLRPSEELHSTKNEM